MWILPKQLHALSGAPDTEAFLLDLNEQSQACAQSLLVRSKPSPQRTWLQKWKRDSWTQHLFGRILKPSHAKPFETAWTSLWRVIPANPSAQQESDLAQKTQDTSGLTSSDQYLLFDLDSVSLKMSKDTSRWDSPQSSAIWKNWVTKCRGEYSARRNASMQVDAQHRTSGSGSSSWPTASVMDTTGGSYKTEWVNGRAVSYHNHTKENPVAYGAKLADAVKHGQAAPASSSSHGSRPELSEQKQWATPRSGKTTDENPETWAKRQAQGDVATMPLTAQVKQWATPSNSMTAGKSEQMNCRAGREGYGHVGNHLLRQTGNTGKLNPRWVETLMGLPVGWTMPSCASPVTIAPTNSDSSETELCQQQQSELF